VLPLPDQVSSRPAERSSQRRPAPLQIVHICAGYRWQRMRTITEQNGGSAASGALKLVTQSDSRSNRLRGDSAAGPRFQSALIDMR
jgi:hypothetical protein